MSREVERATGKSPEPADKSVWYVFSVVAARATERGLQSAGVLVSEGGFGILRARLCGAHVPADKSRAPAAIVVGTPNTYNVSTLGGQFRIA